MKWVKRFAAGMLAAALSLALLCGCSDSTKLDNVKELKYEDSILYLRTRWNSSVGGAGWAMECTRLSNGQTIIMAEKKTAENLHWHQAEGRGERNRKLLFSQWQL